MIGPNLPNSKDFLGKSENRKFLKGDLQKDEIERDEKVKQNFGSIFIVLIIFYRPTLGPAIKSV